MAKMYTLDKKLLTECPEIRIGDKCYPVDNRASTVKKLMKTLDNTDEKSDNISDIIDTDELIIRAAFDKNAKEILNMNLPYTAQQTLSKMALAAMTGEEYEADEDARFRETDEKTESV